MAKDKAHPDKYWFDAQDRKADLKRYEKAIAAEVARKAGKR